MLFHLHDVACFLHRFQLVFCFSQLNLSSFSSWLSFWTFSLGKFIWERNNSWAAINDTFFLTNDAFERHRVVFIVGTSIASVATAWIGYSLRHFHDEKVEQRLESIEKVMKHKHNLEHSEIKDIVGPGGLSVPTCAATAATTLFIGIVPSF
ncbi:hypothetical protein HN51_067513 [Arachis hypogaea]